MKQDCMDALTQGKFVKSQIFETLKGKYAISYVRYKGDVFMFKYLNRKMVEACNLSKMKGIDDNDHS